MGTTRRRTLARPLAGAAALVAVAVLARAQAADTLAIAHVTVVDVAGGTLLPDRTVIVSGERIARVASAAGDVPEGVRLVDGRGKYLIPGLWDMHVHLSLARSSALPALVANGVTYVRDAGSLLSEIDEWRGRIAAGRLTGPVIVRAGPILNGQASNRYHLIVANASDARAAVRTLERVGVDFVKVHRRTPRDAYFAAAEESRRLSLPLAGHVPVTVTPEEASNAGQRTIEHVETLFEGTFTAGLAGAPLVEAIAAWRRSDAAAGLFATFVRNGTVVNPTLIAGRWIIEWLENPSNPRDRYVAASALRERVESLAPLRRDAAALIVQRRAIRRELEAVVGQMHRAGVTLVTGTDLAHILHPGFNVHDELQALVQAGLTPADALRAATINPARLFPSLEAGDVAPGRRADLLLLDGNPLDDIRNTARLRGVILGGRVFDRAALDALLEEAAARAAVN